MEELKKEVILLYVNSLQSILEIGVYILIRKENNREDHEIYRREEEKNGKNRKRKNNDRNREKTYSEK